jgi:serine/threonine protein kinase
MMNKVDQSRHPNPTLYLFQQEFRTRADLSHPNLVRLHELVMTDPEHLFFAMELVRLTENPAGFAAVLVPGRWS